MDSIPNVVAICENSLCDREGDKTTWRERFEGDIPAEIDGRHFCDGMCAVCWLEENGIDFTEEWTDGRYQ